MKQGHVIRIKLVLLLLVFVGFACGKTVVAAYFQGLGDLPGSDFGSVATDVSNNKVVTGFGIYGDSNIESSQLTFRWSDSSGIQSLSPFPDGTRYSDPGAVSSDGSVIVGTNVFAADCQAFLWSESEGMQNLGYLPGGSYSCAHGVSSDGSIVVGDSGSSLAAIGEAYMWTKSNGMQALGDLPGGKFSSGAFDISNDGEVIVGGSMSASGYEAFRWTESEGMQGLGDLPGRRFSSRANAVSADGRVIVGMALSEFGDEAFRWTEDEGMVGLGDLPGSDYWSRAYDVSADGSMIVGVGMGMESGIGMEAFLWDAEHGMRNLQNILENNYGLDLTGWALSSASGISDDGLVITGTGRNPEGNTEAWIAVIPEPTSLILLAVGSFGALRRK